MDAFWRLLFWDDTVHLKKKKNATDNFVMDLSYAYKKIDERNKTNRAALASLLQWDEDYGKQYWRDEKECNFS